MLLNLDKVTHTIKLSHALLHLNAQWISGFPSGGKAALEWG